jgi:hypothetical protein
VYGVVQRHSAEIDIDSALGQGHNGAPELYRIRPPLLLGPRSPWHRGRRRPAYGSYL